MKRIIQIGLVAALAAATIATENEASHDLQDLTVDVGDGVINVSGDTDWVDAPVSLGVDAEGDVLTPGVALDVTLLEVERPNPNSSNLRLTLHVPDMPDGEYNGIGEVVTYLGTILSSNGSEVDIQAWRSAQWNTPGEYRASLTVNTCTTDPNTGQGSCTTADVPGSFADQKIVWNVNAGMLGVFEGDSFDLSVFNVTTGHSGLLWWPNGVVLSGTGVHDSLSPDSTYAFNSPSVKAELIDSDGNVVTSATQKPKSNGTFDLSLDASGFVGEYTVAVTGCYQVDCVTTNTNVTLG